MGLRGGLCRLFIISNKISRLSPFGGSLFWASGECMGDFDLSAVSSAGLRQAVITALNLKELGSLENRVLDELLAGLSAAEAYQNNYGYMYNWGYSLKEIRETLQSALIAVRRLAKCSDLDAVGALNRLRLLLNKVPKDLQHHLYLIPNISPKPILYWGDWLYQSLEALRESSEVRARVCDQISMMLNYTISQLIEPGKGGSRREARKYISGFRELIWYFQCALPDSPVTGSRDSYFFRYAEFWLRNYTEWNGSTPERHIRNAIEAHKSFVKVTPSVS